MSKDKPPNLLTGPADMQLRNPAEGTNSIHIFGLFARVATKHDLRADLVGQKLISLVANEAARAALARRLAHSRMALILAHGFWAAAAGVNIAIWVKRGRLETRPSGRFGRTEPKGQLLYH